MAAMFALPSLSVRTPSLPVSSHQPRPVSASSSFSSSHLLRAGNNRGHAVVSKASNPHAQFLEADRQKAGKRPAEVARDAAADLRQGADRTADDISSTAKAVGQDLRQGSEETGDWAAEKTGETEEYLGERQEEAKEWAEDRADEANAVGQNLQQRGSDAQAYLGKRAEDVSSAAGDVLETAQVKAQETGERTADATQDVFQQAATSVLTFVENALGGPDSSSKDALTDTKRGANKALNRALNNTEGTLAGMRQQMKETKASAEEATKDVQEDVKEVSSPPSSEESVGGRSEKNTELKGETVHGDPKENEHGDMFGTPEEVIEELQEQWSDKIDTGKEKIGGA